MPPIPDVTVAVQDGALGLAAARGDRVQVKLGTSSAGTANVLESVSTIGDLVAKFGQGPLVEAAAVVLSEAGGPVYVMKVAGSVAGAAGAPVATKTGTATLAIAGAPYDAYEVVLEVVKGGATLAAGTATFKYSLDGGRTFSAELAVPTSGVYIIPNSGLTLTWTYSAGTAFVAGDQWTVACTAPGYSTTDLATSFTALLADPRTWFLAHVVGLPADLAGARALFAALATHMATAAASYRFARALMEAPFDTDANLLAITTGFGDLADVRVAVGAGPANITSPISGRSYKRNAAWRAAARAQKLAPSQDLGEVAAGPVPGIVSLVRDEQATPGLDAGRFITLRTIIGRQGYYITRGRLFAPSGSDFTFLQNGRVIDIACSVARDRILTFLNSRLPTNADGTIEDSAAKGIEDVVDDALRNEVVRRGDAVDSSVTIDRTINLMTTGLVKAKVRVQPFGYASAIEVEVGFTSPALAAAA
jgi:uncharacterized protein DUF2586